MNALMLNMVPMLAAADGEGLLNKLMMILLIGICVAIVWAFGRWVIGKFGAPEIVMTCWHGLFLLLGVIFVINFLMDLAGHPFLKW